MSIRFPPRIGWPRIEDAFQCPWCCNVQTIPGEPGTVTCLGCNKAVFVTWDDDARDDDIYAYPAVTATDRRYCAAMGIDIPEHVKDAR